MISITVDKKDSGQRVDKFIMRVLPNAPKSLIFKQMRGKNITLNRKKISGSEILSQGDSLEIFFSQETFDKFSGKSETVDLSEYINAYKKIGRLEIIYEDDNVVIINKPAGILTQKSTSDDISLNEWLIGYLIQNKKLTENDIRMYKPSCMNRLDRNTSGMCLGAKTLLGSSTLAQLIKERDIEKYYHTYMLGEVNRDMELFGYLCKDDDKNRVTIYDSPMHESDVKIHTKVHPIRVIENKELGIKYTFAEIELVTGKSHQIRAHMSHIGHPLLGDYKYGDKSVNDKLKSLYRIESQLLHASILKFPKDTGELKELSERVFVCKEPDIYGNLEKQRS